MHKIKQKTSGKRISFLRSLAQISQKNLASIVQMSRSAIDALENSRSSLMPRTAEKIAEAFHKFDIDVTPEWLLTGIPPHPEILNSILAHKVPDIDQTFESLTTFLETATKFTINQKNDFLKIGSRVLAHPCSKQIENYVKEPFLIVTENHHICAYKLHNIHQTLFLAKTCDSSSWIPITHEMKFFIPFITLHKY